MTALARSSRGRADAFSDSELALPQKKIFSSLTSYGEQISSSRTVVTHWLQSFSPLASASSMRVIDGTLMGVLGSVLESSLEFSYLSVRNRALGNVL